MVNPQVVPTIVVSRPGVMQQALRTSLSIYPPIVVITCAGDGLTALKQIVARHPALVVIDANLLPDESEALLVAIKAEPAPPRCLVFVQSTQHAAAMVAAGADAVIRRDDPAHELKEALARLIQPRT